MTIKTIIIMKNLFFNSVLSAMGQAAPQFVPVVSFYSGQNQSVIGQSAPQFAPVGLKSQAVSVKRNC